MTGRASRSATWPLALVATLALGQLACGRSEPYADTEPATARPLTEAIQRSFPGLPRDLPPMNDPRVVDVASASHMRDDDVVLGVLLGDRARAYPWWIAKNYHAINDTVADTPVLVALCEQCSAATAYRRQLGSDVLSMIVLGIYRGTIILSDVETGSLWSPFEGVALEGPLEGRQLDRLPGFLLRWSDWVDRHPETEVIFDEEWRRGGHGSGYAPGEWGIVEEMGRTLDRWDTRLPENTMVLGIDAGGSSKAYPFDAVLGAGGVLNDRVGGRPVLVLAQGEFELVGYGRELEGRELSFQRSSLPGSFMEDIETRSQWSLEGEARDGPLAGATLDRVEGFAGEWHVWSGYNPDTELLATERHNNLPDDARFPVLDLTRLNPGEDVELKRAVNVIELWASWCPPCKIELPRLQQLADGWADRDVAVATVAVHIAYERRIHDFLRDLKIRLPVYLIDDPHYRALEELSLATTGQGVILPTVFVVDGERRVRAVLQGDAVDELERIVEELLSDPIR